MTIYIAGKMTGLPGKGRATFSREAERLRKAGHIVLNSAELPEGKEILHEGDYRP